jgi:feruloyl-CoA synthase
MTAWRAPFKPIDFAPPRVEVDRRPDGSMILRSPIEVGPVPRAVGDILERQAEANPDRIFLAERASAGGWRKVSYRDFRDGTRRLGQALLDRGCSPERPVTILSDNGIDHALLTFAAMHVGVPAAPVSVAYSLMSQDHAKLIHVIRSITPAVIYASRGAPYEKAFQALERAGLLEGVSLVFGDRSPDGIAGETFASLETTRATDAVDRAFAATGPDTIAKVLFTSGSTGMPKGVINTQRMLCSNQAALSHIYRFLRERPPVVVDWLPWNHTFGANHNVHLVLWHGGTMYIDEGKPASGLVEKTVQTLREVSPTLYFNVPRGYDMLLPYLEREPELRESFFRDLDFAFYGGAALPQTLWDRLDRLSVETIGRRVTLTCSWGSTETAPLATTQHWQTDRSGGIGLPIPGVELMLTPNGAKQELRVRGPNVTPGYWRRPDLTAGAFDAEGFYRIGDAGRLVDDADPAKGIMFDGRVVEDFKLGSGTWVHVGGLRVAAISAGAPVIQDAVVTGHDREEVGLLVFPNLAGCLSLVPGAPADTPLPDLVRRAEVRAALAKGLAVHNQAHAGSSTRITRTLILATPPSIDANEITDKGYVNQRAVLESRAADVARLYAEPDDAEIIRVPS